ncbi:YibE/F family protein [Nocardioides scoriae]|uniref:YibE/F family protein n=1 Tax=Nocardioides scoriae TaxID=642780 RepID=UPI001E62FF54|nr:YibE/F family protein [Nocardioides scoriae]
MTGRHAHAHSHLDAPDGPDVGSRPGARRALLAFLGVAGLATVLGLVLLWPQGDARVEDASAAFVAPGVTFQSAEVTDVAEACPAPQPAGGTGGTGSDPAAPTPGTSRGDVERQQGCGQVSARVLTGDEAGTEVTVGVPPEVSRSGLRSGDRVQLLQVPSQAGTETPFSFVNVERNAPIGWLALAFVVVVALVARLRGLLALVGLGVGALVLVRFVLPALLEGGDGLLVAMTGSSAIMFVVLYLAHGVSVRTSAALAGTLLGVAVTAAIGILAIDRTRLTGVSDETGQLLATFLTDLDFQGLLTCAVIVAGLGVLNDVTITQASAVWELRAVAPELGRAELFTRGMRIGRDHIASTIYTIVFAYSGAALSVLLLLSFYERPALSLVSTEDFAEEIVRTLASGIGLVLAVPITTAIAALTVEAARPRDTADA